MYAPSERASCDRPLSPNAVADVLNQHFRLTVLRFTEAADLIAQEYPSLSGETGMSTAWKAMPLLGRGWLERAAKTPYFHAWTTTAERLLERGVFAAYPDGHVRRHLYDFNRLLLTSCTFASGDMDGAVRVLRRTAVPLLFGEAWLRGPADFDGTLEWSVRSDRLHVQVGGGPTLLESDFADLSRARSHDADWQVVPVDRIDGVLVDTWSVEYASNAGPAGSFLDRCRQAFADLGQDDREFVRGTLRVLTARHNNGRWVSGLGAFEPDVVAANTLLEVAYREWIECCVDVAAYTEGFQLGTHVVASRELRDALVRTGARVLMGEESAIPAWNECASRIEDLAGGDAAIAMMGLPRSARERSVQRTGVVSGGDMLTFSGPEAADLLAPARVLRKQRRAAGDQIDWSGIDSLCGVDVRRLVEIRDALAPANDEASSWVAACCAYHSGDWIGCAERVLTCLTHDSDVEQYWMLLAFAFRHMHRRDVFERIVFDGERSVENLAGTGKQPAEPLAETRNLIPCIPCGSRALSWNWTGLLRDFVAARNSELQLTQYVAVMAQIRRSLDDWIPVNRLDGFLELANRSGLAVEIDCTFEPLTPDAGVLGSSIAPTTQAFGRRYDAGGTADSGATVHVFVSSRKDWAAEALAAGWYSVAIGGRRVWKPRSEHRLLGRAFGYPDCCVDFYMRHNDWTRKNTFVEALRRSESIRWQTNCIPRHTPFMAMFHLPCRFDCAATYGQTIALMRELRRVDAAYADRVEHFLRQPCLVINEISCYVLLGARWLGDSHVEYESAIHAGGKRHLDPYADDLETGAEIEVANGAITIRRSGQVKVIETRCDTGGIELPVLLRFD